MGTILRGGLIDTYIYICPLLLVLIHMPSMVLIIVIENRNDLSLFLGEVRDLIIDDGTN